MSVSDARKDLLSMLEKEPAGHKIAGRLYMGIMKTKPILDRAN